MGEPALSEIIENTPTKLAESGTKAPESRGKRIEGYTTIQENRNAGREFDHDIISDNVQSKERLIARDFTHRQERGDWFYGRVTRAYREGHERTFGEQDIFKNLAD